MDYNEGWNKGDTDYSKDVLVIRRSDTRLVWSWRHGARPDDDTRSAQRWLAEQEVIKRGINVPWVNVDMPSHEYDAFPWSEWVPLGLYKDSAPQSEENFTETRERIALDETTGTLLMFSTSRLYLMRDYRQVFAGAKPEFEVCINLDKLIESPYFSELKKKRSDGDYPYISITNDGRFVAVVFDCPFILDVSLLTKVEDLRVTVLWPPPDLHAPTPMCEDLMENVHLGPGGSYIVVARNDLCDITPDQDYGGINNCYGFQQWDFISPLAGRVAALAQPSSKIDRKRARTE